MSCSGTFGRRNSVEIVYENFFSCRGFFLKKSKVVSILLYHDNGAADPEPEGAPGLPRGARRPAPVRGHAGPGAAAVRGGLNARGVGEP